MRQIRRVRPQNHQLRTGAANRIIPRALEQVASFCFGAWLRTSGNQRWQDFCRKDYPRFHKFSNGLKKKRQVFRPAQSYLQRRLYYFDHELIWNMGHNR